MLTKNSKVIPNLCMCLGSSILKINKKFLDEIKRDKKIG